MPTIINANCLDALRNMPDNSVDAICTDPPYGLSNTTPDKVADTIVRWASGDREHVPAGKGFMGAEWDAFVPPPAVWDECYRVLKPGGHMAVFAGTRTMDLMTLGIRLAGFDIRDSLAWLYGSGFPKSMDVSKAIDKVANAERKVIGQSATVTPRNGKTGAGFAPGGMIRWGDEHYKWEDAPPNAIAYFTEQAAKRGQITAPATDAAKQWSGWGTALKPAHEPILLARKPLQGTVAANVTTWGTGAINIDATRIGTEAGRPFPAARGGTFLLDGCQSLEELEQLAADGAKTPNGRDARATLARYREHRAKAVANAGDGKSSQGRFPANVVLDEYAAHELDQQTGDLSYNPPAKWVGGTGTSDGWGNIGKAEPGATRTGFGDKGGASRFFYVAKAPKRERPNVDGVAHPTVKPLALMRWLVRLLTPPGGVVLDPFAGSGTTVEAAMLEGFHPVGIEREAEYLPLIQQRIDRATGQLPMAS